MANNQCEIKFEGGKIVCFLPITLPTSKVRIKRNDEPVAVCQVSLQEDDLIEWQISYYDRDRNLIEIGLMLKIGYEKGLFSRSDLEHLKRFAENVQNFFSDVFEIEKLNADELFLNEFEVLYRKVPIIRKELTNGCFVEGELKHKQRAVGYQPMLYIFIPIKNVISIIDKRPLFGRPAHSKEMILWFPSLEDIKGTIKTFSVLSPVHNRDIKEILINLL